MRMVKSTVEPDDTATLKLALSNATVAPPVSVLDAAGLPVSSKTHANLFATGGISSTYSFGNGSDVLTATSVTTSSKLKEYSKLVSVL